MINILLFTNLKEKFGKDNMEYNGNGKSISQLKEQLIAEFQLAEELKAVMVAVNEEFVDEDYILVDGDTVAFIPPVSGG
ncbi:MULTISPECIES: molybdopterin converting factor subunit 1 [Bacillus]|uniref:molybdopterin converting factor subunit 1 n=1 Tax=Bacillus TaxID=1386 RepID=UPI000303E1CF|nr:MULTISPECIES: molybdopterin converting factor subunit 1 [Bacillus]